MSDIRIRLAVRQDGEAALGLWRVLQQEHESLDERYRVSEDAAARWSTDFRSWTRSHSSRVWVAEDESGLVGLLTAHLAEPSPMYEGPMFVFVTDLVTLPHTRGQGVGRDLLAAARAWGVEVGAGELRAGVMATNPAGRRFWEREGASDYTITMTLPLAR